MAGAEHTVVKAADIPRTTVGMLDQELILPKLFIREGMEGYQGKLGDTKTLRVPGVLPFHLYEFRADRLGTRRDPEPHDGRIKFDTYAERTVDVGMIGNAYSASKITDEQVDFDLINPDNLMRMQARAIARGLNQEAAARVENAAYEVTIGITEDATGAGIRSALVEARRVLNRFRVQGRRILLVGTNVEAAMLNAERLTFAQIVGDNTAESALRDATLGRLFGFDVIVDQTIDPDTAFAFVSSGFVMANAAPTVPKSAPAGGTASFEGFSLRWIRDYDTEFFQDRVVTNTWYGFSEVEDVLMGYDPAARSEVVSADEYFVRGVRLELGGLSVYPAIDSELNVITGVTPATP